MFTLITSNDKDDQDDQELGVSQLSTDLSLSTGSVNNRREFGDIRGKIKRKRGLDGSGITIGTGSSSGQLRKKYDHVQCSKWCDTFGSGYGGFDSSLLSRNKSLLPIPNHHQSANEDSSSESGKNKMRIYGRGVAGFVDVPVSDKIHRRILKNRESAARSRARKLAVEAQQQQENSELKKENDILKNVVRFLLAIIRTKHMKLPEMTRSSSAPF